MASGDWELEVVSVKQMIDDSEIDMLAYDVKFKDRQSISQLELYPVEDADFQLFKKCYIEFLLLWKSSSGRNDMGKRRRSCVLMQRKCLF